MNYLKVLSCISLITAVDNYYQQEHRQMASACVLSAGLLSTSSFLVAGF